MLPGLASYSLWNICIYDGNTHTHTHIMENQYPCTVIKFAVTATNIFGIFANIHSIFFLANKPLIKIRVAICPAYATEFPSLFFWVCDTILNENLNESHSLELWGDLFIHITLNWHLSFALPFHFFLSAVMQTEHPNCHSDASWSHATGPGRLLVASRHENNSLLNLQKLSLLYTQFPNLRYMAQHIVCLLIAL